MTEIVLSAIGFKSNDDAVAGPTKTSLKRNQMCPKYWSSQSLDDRTVEKAPLP
jgi:hypothetical protein